MTSTTIETSETRDIVASVRDAYVGRAADGGRLFLSIEVRHIIGRSRETIGPDVETVTVPAGPDADPGETREIVRHVMVSDYFEVFVMGAYMHKGSKLHDWTSCGQNRDDFRGAVADPRASHWTREDIRSAVAIWDRWHLNGMKAGCAHGPTPLYEESNYGPRPDLLNTPPCPETGYRWGHSWLVEPVPADVVAELSRLAEIPRGNVPAWL